MSRLSILIVTWNSAAWIGRCLASLDPSRYEVIVWDNASDDGTPALVARDFPAVHLVASTVNRGFAGGVNGAARAASGDRFLLLNPDTRVTPGAIETLCAALDETRADAAGGALTDAAGVVQRGFTVRRFPTLATWAVDLLLLDHLWPANPVTRRYRRIDLPLDRISRVEQPAAACLLVRRAVFEALDGFDEQFHPAWFEDVDFCRRLVARGGRIIFVPRARFEHQGAVAMRTLGPAFPAIWYRNLERYAAKHHGRFTQRVLRLLILAGLSLRAVIHFARGDRAGARTWVRTFRSIVSSGPRGALPGP